MSYTSVLGDSTSVLSDSVWAYRSLLAAISSVTGGTNVTLTGTSTAPIVNVPGPLTINTVLQPFIQHGETVGNGTSGTVTVTLPVAYSSLPAYNVFATLRDPQVVGTALTITKNSASQFTINFNVGTAGAHNIAWNTMGN
jgi:hypothetical protein